MVDFEAALDGHHRKTGPVSGVASQAANVFGDMLELAELQAKLAKADAVQVTSDALRPILWLVLGICAAIASLPVLTLGIASLVDNLTAMNTWQSQTLVGLLVLVLAIALVYLSIRQLLRAALRFQRSADELAKNVAWMKAVVRSTSSHERHS